MMVQVGKFLVRLQEFKVMVRLGVLYEYKEVVWKE